MDDNKYFVCEACEEGPCPSHDKYCPQSRPDAQWELFEEVFCGGGTVR